MLTCRGMRTKNGKRIEMGTGYNYKCKKCGCEFTMLLGSGFLGYESCEKAKDEILSGELGEEWKTAYSSTSRPAICREKAVFICDCCGHWLRDDLTVLYAPDDIESVEEIFEGKEPPYFWFRGEEDGLFRIVKQTEKICPECGKTMRRANENDFAKLPCPECGEPNAAAAGILWD